MRNDLNGQSGRFGNLRASTGRLLAVATCAALLLPQALLDAATNTWNVGAGTGTWDGTTANWLSPAVWNNSPFDTAIFGGTAGTVTLGSNFSPNVGGLTFNTAGYTIAPAGTTPLAMNLADGSVVSLGYASGTTTMNQVIAGTGNFLGNWTVSGSGAGGQILTLGGTNTYVGALRVNNGAVLSLAAAGALGHAQSDLILDNGTLQLTGGQFDVNLGRTIRVGAGGATFNNAPKILMQAPNALAGSGTLTKLGAGTFQPTRANTGFTGNFVHAAGALELQNAFALGTGVGQTITLQGGELVLSGANQNVWTNAISIPHAIVYKSGMISADNGPGATIAGPITIDPTAAQLEVGLRYFYQTNTPSFVSITGAIAGTKDININKSTTAGQQHFLTLGGNNSAWSGVLKTAGTVGIGADVIVEALNNDNNLGTGTVTLNGGTVRFSYAPTTAVGVAAAGITGSYYNQGTGSLLSGIQSAGPGTNGSVTTFTVPALTTRVDQSIDAPNSAGGTLFTNPVAGWTPFNNTVAWNGTLNVASGGTYTFFTGSDDGTQVFIDGQRVVDNDQGHGFPGPIAAAASNTTNMMHTTNAVTLSAGSHSIVVKYGQGTGGGAAILDWSGPDTGNIRTRVTGSTTSGFDTRTWTGATSARNIAIANAATGTIDTASDLNYTGNLTFAGGASTLNFASTLRNTITAQNGFAIPGAATTNLNAHSADVVLKGVISEAAANGAVSFGGSASTTLANANTYTGATTVAFSSYIHGPTTVNYGVLALNNLTGSGNAIPGTLTINTGTVKLLASDQIADTSAVAVAGALGTTALDLGTFSETVGTFTLNGGTLVGNGTGLTLTSAAANSFGAGATDQLKAGTVTVTKGTLAIPLHGASGLTWNSTGNTLGLAAANDYTGLTTVTAGILQLNGSGTAGVAGNFASGNATSVASGAQLQLINGATLGDDINIAGTGTAADGALRSVAQNIVLGGIPGSVVGVGQNNTHVVNGVVNLTANASIRTDGMSTLTLNGGITSSGGFSLTVDGAGKLTVPGSVALNAGALTVAGDVRIGGTTVAGSVTSTPVGRADFAGGLTSAGAVNTGAAGVATGTTALNGGLTISGAGAGMNVNAPTEFGAVSTNGGSIVINGSADTTFNGAMALGAGTISRAVGATGKMTFNVDLATDPTLAALALSGNNVVLNGTQTLPAITVPGGGRLEVGSAASLPAGTTVNAGGVFSSGYAIDNGLLGTVAPASTGTVALGASSGNNLTIPGALTGISLGAVRPVTLSGTLTPAGSTFRLGGGGSTLAVTSVLSGANALTVSGSGTVDLTSGRNSFTGAVTVNGGGTLRIKDTTNLGNAANGITLDGGTLEISDLSMTGVSSALGQNMTILPRTVTIGAGGGTINVQPNSNVVIAGVNALTGSGAFTKAGLGEFQLGSSNNFSGTATVASQGGVFFLKGGAQLPNLGGLNVLQNGRVELDHPSGIGPVTTGGTRNVISDTAPVMLAGGALNFTGQAAGSSETVGVVSLGIGQSSMQVTGSGTVTAPSSLVLSGLGFAVSNPNKASVVRLIGGTGILGQASGANSKIAITGQADGWIGGHVVVGTADFGAYLGANSSVGAYGSSGFPAYGAALTTGTIASLVADAAVTGNTSVGALRLAGAATRNVTFTTAGGFTADRLFVENGAILSDGNNNARNIGTTANRGVLTAGFVSGASNNVARTLYLNNNANTLLIESLLVDNPGIDGTFGNADDMPVTVVKALDGQVTLGPNIGSVVGVNAKPYSGGTYVLRGTLQGNSTGSLGSGPVFVQNSRLAVNNAGVTTSTAGITVTDGAELYLNNGGATFNGAGDRYNLASGTVLLGPNASNANQGLNSITRVTALTAGGQAILAPGAIVSHQSFLNGVNGTGNNTIKFAAGTGNNADLFYGISGTVNAGSNYSVTLGSGTPWMGLSTDRSTRRFQQGTIFVNSDFVLQGMQRDGGYSILQLGGGGVSAQNSINILSTNSSAMSAIIRGIVEIDEDNPIRVSSNIGFEVEPGAILYTYRPNAFGSGADIASGVHVQAGGTLAVGMGTGAATVSAWGFSDTEAGSLNAPVTVDSGARLLVGTGSNGTGNGIGAGAPITLKTNSILHLASPQSLLGFTPGRVTYEPGVVARIEADNIFNLNTRVAQNATFEIFNGDRQLTSQVDFATARANSFASNPYAPLLDPQNFTIDGGILTNDAPSRLVTTRGDRYSGALVVGAAGATIAASGNSTLSIGDDIQLAAGRTLTIGYNGSIDGAIKVGLPSIVGQPGGNAGIVNLTANNSNILDGTVNIVNGGELSFGGVNVWPDNKTLDLPIAPTGSLPTSNDRPGTGSVLLINTGTPEIIGGLTGKGVILSNQGTGNGVLVVGGGNATSAFNGIFSTTGTQQPSLTKIGTGALSLTNTSNSTGSLNIYNGQVVLKDDAVAGTVGKVAFAQTFLSGGQLILDNSASALNNRLSGKDIALVGGEFVLKGNGTTSVTETIANLRIGSVAVGGHRIDGFGIVTVDPNGAAATTLEFSGGVTNSFQNGAASALFRGPGLAGTPGTTAITGAVTAAPAANGLIKSTGNPNLWSNFGSNFAPNTLGGAVNGGGGIVGSIGTPVAAVRGDIVASSSLTGTGGGSNDGFVTMDTLASGFRILAASEYSSSIRQNGEIGSNINLTGSTTVAGGSSRFQTLTLQAGSSLTQTSTIPFTENPSRLWVNTGGIRVPTGATSTITTPILNTNHPSGNNIPLYFWTYGDLTVNARLTSGNGIVKNGPGTLTLGPDALAVVVNQNQSFSLNDGTLKMTGTGANPLYVNYPGAGGFNFGGQRVNINGGTWDLSGRSQIVGDLYSTDVLWNTAVAETGGVGGTITSASPATFTVQNSTQFGGHFTGAISLNKAGNNGGAGAFTLTGSQSYTGATWIRAGTLKLKTDAALTATSSIEIAQGTLEIDDTGLVQMSDRIGNSVPVNLRGAAQVSLIGGRNAVTETLGTVTSVNGNNTLAVGAGQSTSADLTVTNLVRNPGSTVVMTTTQGSGSNATGGGILGMAGSSFTNPHIFLTNINGAAPTLTNGILGGAYTNGSEWLSYDPSRGVTIFGRSDLGTQLYSANALQDGVATDNINIGQWSGTSQTADYIFADKTINSLRFQSGATVSLGGKLTVNTGGVLVNNVAANIDGGSITSGGSELFFTVSGNTLSVQSAVVDGPSSMALVKSGGGTLALLGANTYTGKTYINGGTVTANPLDGGVIFNNDIEVSSGATLQLQRGGTIAPTATLTINGAGTINWNFPLANGTDTVRRLVINNTGGTGQATFGGSSTNAGVITFTDPTPVTVVNDNITRETVISSGIGGVAFAPTSGTTATLDIGGTSLFGMVMNANVTAVPSGGLIKTGTGLLSMSPGGSTYGNPGTPTQVWDIQQGAIRADSASALGSGNAITRVGSDGALILHNGATVNGSVNLAGGVLSTNVGNSTLAGNLSVSADSSIRTYEEYNASTARTLTVSGVVSGSSAINLLGSPYFNTLGTLLLSNTANTFTGAYNVPANANLQVQPATTGGSLGAASAVVNLNGGRLSLRDNNAFTYNNTVNLNGHSSISVDRVSANSNNTLSLSLLNVSAGERALNVISGNGYNLGATLGGSGTLMKVGTGNLVINGYDAGWTGSFGFAGPVGTSQQHNYTRDSIGGTGAQAGIPNVTFAASNTFTDLKVNGFTTLPGGKSFSVGTLSVNKNDGNLSGHLAITGGGSPTTLSATTLQNDGRIGAWSTIQSVGGNASLTATNVQGSGQFTALGASLTINGNLTSGTPSISGDNSVIVTGSTHTFTSLGVQSGTLKLAPAGNASTTGDIRVFGNAVDATLKQGAIAATLDYGAPTGSQITTAGNVTNNGIVKVSTGAAVVNGMIAGTTAQYVPGLREGAIINAVATTSGYDATAARPNNAGQFGIVLEPRMGQTNVVTNNPITGWGDNQTWIYTGWVKDDDGVFSFAENIDDNVQIAIDGVNRVNNNAGTTAYNTVTSTAYSVGMRAGANLETTITGAGGATPATNFGAGVTLPGYGDGWHRIEIRISNGQGGAGPAVGNGFDNNYGIGYKNGIGALDGADYIKPIDNGTGNLFVTEVSGKGEIQIDSGATLTAQGFTMTSRVAYGLAGVGASTFNVTGTGAAIVSDTDKIEVASTATSSNTMNITRAIDKVVTPKLNVADSKVFFLNKAGLSMGELEVTSGSDITGNINANINIEGGTLRVSNTSGSATGDAVINVIDGKLAGNGIVTGSVNVNGGTISPGNSPGILTIGDASGSGLFMAAGTLEIEIGGTTPGVNQDQLVVNGFVDLAGGDLNLLWNAVPTVGDKMFIVLNDAVDAIGSPFNSHPDMTGTVIYDNGGGIKYTIHYVADSTGGTLTGGNDVALSIVAVPEPASLALLAGAVSGLLIRRRRK